jgi:hypothetical protein
MIRIRRARLPEGLQALARHDHGTVVVHVSAALSASERAAAIRRALRAAPEAGWRSPRSPVVLPALAGGAGLPLAPGGRWAYRALFAAAAAAVIAVITVLVLAGGSPGHRTARSTTALRPAASPTAPGPARPSGPGPGTGPGAVSGAGPSPPKCPACWWTASGAGQPDSGTVLRVIRGGNTGRADTGGEQTQ